MWWVGVLVTVPLAAAFGQHTLNTYTEARTDAIVDLKTLTNDLNIATAEMGWSVALHLKRADVAPGVMARAQLVAADISRLEADDVTYGGISTSLKAASDFMLTLQ